MEPQASAPVNRLDFVDEVDCLIEVTDIDVAGFTTLSSRPAPSTSSPIFTEIVDQLVEYTDSPTERHSAGETGLRPVFVDEVDSLVEFNDQPISDAAEIQRLVGCDAVRKRTVVLPFAPPISLGKTQETV